ncbi:MAG TPA: hypothetical protein VH558_16760 [Pseudolabrys sp.]
MREVRILTGPAMQLSEATRDQIALGIWFAVLAGVLFLSFRGQSILMTAGLMFELTAAYSTFLLCGKVERSHSVHAVPYAFAFTGAVLLCLAPDFRNAIQASVAFLAVTILMHGSVVYSARKDVPEAEDPICMSAT